MVSGLRRVQLGLSVATLAALCGIALSCGAEPPRVADLPLAARVVRTDPSGSGTAGSDTRDPSDTAADEPYGTGTLVAADLESSSSTEASSTTAADDNTTMAPSTSSLRKPTTPVTLSTKRPPTGPGVPPIPAYTMSPEERDFFNCVVYRESSGNPGAINYSSGAAGLFQFLPSTWDATARHIGRGDLVGVNPALAPSDLQWYFAHVLFLWQGTSPWLSDGCQIRRPSPTTDAPPLTPTTPSWVSPTVTSAVTTTTTVESTTTPPTSG